MKKITSLALGFLTLLIIQFTANCIIKYLHLSFPSPLLGMVILALLLYFKVIPEKFLKSICDLLLNNMSLFFIPLFVGIISYAHLIKQNLLSITLIIILTTFGTMIITASLVEFIIKKTTKEKVS